MFRHVKYKRFAAYFSLSTPHSDFAIGFAYNAIGKKSWTPKTSGAIFRHMAAENLPPEVPMNSLLHPSERRSVVICRQLRRFRQPLNLIFIFVVFPTLALAQAGGSPFDTGFTALQTLFTGTVAKVASLIAIVVGGYEFAHGEPGAKKDRIQPTSVVYVMWNLGNCKSFRLARHRCALCVKRTGLSV